MRRSGALAAVGLTAAGAAGAAVGVAVHFARRVLTPAASPDARVEVVGLEAGGGFVWLRGPECDLEGSYSYIFDVGDRFEQVRAGHARLGQVRQRDVVQGRLRVQREVLSVQRGALRIGARGRITGWWFTEPEQLGYPVTRLELHLPGGPASAWLIRPDVAEQERWAIHVHGRGALPHETLRGVKPFAEAGIPSLVISYRNDPDAPTGLRGRYGLGLAERFDVEAAIDRALAGGAKRITLVGWSMGAAACVLASSGRHAGAVDSLVLDSPALDWAEILDAQARLVRLPTAFARLGRALLQCGVVHGAVPGERRTDLRSMSGERLIESIAVPTLIHAGPGDTFVPWGAAQRAARLHPELVRVTGAAGEHVKLWNVDPEGWERETSRFIARLSLD